jgi:hypothetical protein
MVVVVNGVDEDSEEAKKNDEENTKDHFVIFSLFDAVFPYIELQSTLLCRFCLS